MNPQRTGSKRMADIRPVREVAIISRRQNPIEHSPPTNHEPQSADTKTGVTQVKSSPSLLSLRSRFFTRDKDSSKAPRTRKKRLAIRGTLLCAVILILLSGYYLIARPAIRIAGGNQTKGVISTKVLDKPNYSTVLPTGKTINDLGGWTRVSPPDKNPVFAYIDTIGKVPINVSQQPLPDDFKSDTSQQIANLAKGYRADNKIVTGDTTIYIGTSAKGPQSAILTKNNLLILIKSSVRIDDNQWATYINSLQ